MANSAAVGRWRKSLTARLHRLSSLQARGPYLGVGFFVSSVFTVSSWPPITRRLVRPHIVSIITSPHVTLQICFIITHHPLPKATQDRLRYRVALR